MLEMPQEPGGSELLRQGWQTLLQSTCPTWILTSAQDIWVHDCKQLSWVTYDDPFREKRLVPWILIMASIEAVLLPFICRIQDQEQQQQKLYYVGHRRQVEEESQNEDCMCSLQIWPMTHIVLGSLLCHIPAFSTFLLKWYVYYLFRFPVLNILLFYKFI